MSLKHIFKPVTAEEVPLYRRWLARLHGELQIKIPTIFGPHEIRAVKSGELKADDAPVEWKSLLRGPGGEGEVSFNSDSKKWVVEGKSGGYPDLNGIPILIGADQSE